MSKMYERIRAGLEDVLAHAEGRPSGVVVRRVAVADVAAIRHRLGLSQEKFARVFGVSVGTLRGWEQGRRAPDGTARVLLTVIDREPEAVLRALGIPPAKRAA